MREWIAGVALWSVMASAPAQGDCDGIRIDYEASIPSINTAMAPWSEIPRNFPQARGITSRTIHVTAGRLIEIQRGTAIKATISKDMLTPAPGIHFRDREGREILWVGYEQVPLHLLTIRSADERIRYSSLTGKARRTAIDEPDDDTADALLSLESSAEMIGEREYAGARCMAKRIPMLGARTETCVRQYHGWPVALYLQFDMPENGGLQWFRATKIVQGACMPEHEAAVPADAQFVDRLAKKKRRSGA
ncbi:MAG TPA: hypothetical protein PKE27_02640 [Povalibacter sp.]|uniref:hypothetical protein n=1 Tax=Povalibacter sp. TaxID=1962978 RepID=UPI002C94C8DB|nr:hypothetical protein [Povalibacter sp.]HMN43438.1 hypothetical protein [Povalibacter sp.]